MAGAELLVPGWLASSAIRSVIIKAQHLAAKYKLQKDTERLVEILKEKLAMIIATVEVSEELMIKIKDPHLSTWLKILKEAAYDAEDVLDNMGAKFIKEHVHGKNKVSKFASASLNVLIPDDNHKKLKKVIRISDKIPNFLELVNMQERKNSINNEFSDLTETIYGPLEEVDLEKIYGPLEEVDLETIYGPLEEVDLNVREEELNLILEIMLNPKSGFSRLEGMAGSSRYRWGRQNYNYHGLLVLPIIGMGGVGKTALAQAVYNNPEVQQTFEAKAWISVSCNLNVKLVMQKLIHSFRGYQCLDGMTLEDSSVNLSSVIDGVRFFIVLDGVCENIENEWDDLCTTLSKGAPGSVVLLTTQNQEFADRVETLGHIALTPLMPKVFWELFKHFVFDKIQISEEKRRLLEYFGREIALKLHGLPLEAEIIGKILRRNIDDLDEWRRISRSKWWDMPEIGGRSKFLPYIGVGYQHLDPRLRKCFAYCSLFPRNSLIEKERLVQMWIAQDFIPHDGNLSSELENVGREWFDKLVAMSIFQSTGDNKGYVMPSQMHELAIIVSSEECFFLSDKSQEIPESVRHLSVDPKDVEVVDKIRKHKKLRSFLYFGSSQVNGIDIAINNTLRELDRIRVLDLSYLQMGTENPPSAIQNMPHLRFLNLSSTGIKRLTRSMFDHYHLQSLHIQQCQLLNLPRSINKLIRIRHLNANAETIALISGLGQLVDLQELDEYRVGIKEGHKITELKNLGKLTGHLRIVNCENIKSKEEATQARMVEKKNLHSVEICWNSAQREAKIDKEILEGLKPHNDIKELKIEGYLGSSFPDWMTEMSSFQNLQTLRLISCINVEILPFLGTSYSLSTLEIVDNLSLREAPLQCFPKLLRALKIVGCHNLNSLANSLPHLTFLSLLHVVNCNLSISLNINGLIRLEELMLMDCPELSIEGDLQLLRNLKCLEISNVPLIRSSLGRTINKPQ